MVSTPLCLLSIEFEYFIVLEDLLLKNTPPCNSISGDD